MIIGHFQCSKCLSDNVGLSHREVDNGTDPETNYHDISQETTFTCSDCGFTGSLDDNLLYTIDEVTK